MDTYTRRARLYPAFIATLPVFFALLAWFPGAAWDPKTLYSLLAGSGVLLLVAQLTRYLGKRQERALFDSWGGPPSSARLRFRGAKNRALVERYHSKLSQIMPDIRLPSDKEEREDPGRADEVYETCINHLRERTRDKAAFPLLFEENCNYGFWRNLWGLKPIGITLSVIGSVAVAAALYTWERSGVDLSPFAVAAELINIGLVAMWVTFKPDRVRLAADAYAERLLASCEILTVAQRTV
jgi:hypothetical protein